MKLSPHYAARCPDDDLIDFAKNTLGMQRCRQSTIQALRHVLGNQALAERIGARLQMSREVDFATPQTMRTLIDRFVAAGVAVKATVQCAKGCPNEVAVFLGVPSDRGKYENEYIRLQRAQEDEDFHRMAVLPNTVTCRLRPEDVPY